MSFVIKYVPDFLPVVAPKMVEAGADIMEKALESSLKESITASYNAASSEWRSKKKPFPRRKPHNSSLVASIKHSHSFIRNQGTFFKSNVYFVGVRPEGKRQGEIAAYKNYGAPKKDRFRMPSNFIKEANEKSRRNINRVMQEIFEAKVEQLTLSQ